MDEGPRRRKGHEAAPLPGQGEGEEEGPEEGAEAVKRPRMRRGPWEEYAIAVLLEKGIGAVVDVVSSRTSAALEEWQRHASGEAEREFVERFDEALAAEPELDDDDEEDV